MHGPDLSQLWQQTPSTKHCCSSNKRNVNQLCGLRLMESTVSNSKPRHFNRSNALPNCPYPTRPCSWASSSRIRSCIAPACPWLLQAAAPRARLAPSRVAPNANPSPFLTANGAPRTPAPTTAHPAVLAKARLATIAAYARRPLSSYSMLRRACKRMAALASSDFACSSSSSTIFKPRSFRLQDWSPRLSGTPGYSIIMAASNPLRPAAPANRRALLVQDLESLLPAYFRPPLVALAC